MGVPEVLFGTIKPDTFKSAGKEQAAGVWEP